MNRWAVVAANTINNNGSLGVLTYTTLEEAQAAARQFAGNGDIAIYELAYSVKTTVIFLSEERDP